MGRLSQQHHPHLWTLFQGLIGGAVDKRRLCLRWFRGQQRVLEIGCSTGTIATAFRAFRNVQYVGYDIDPKAIAFAQARFRRDPRFQFRLCDVRSEAVESERFDYVLVAGVLHHLDDASCLDLVAGARDRLAEDGWLVVVEPVLPEPDDGFLLRWFLRLEQGQWVRRAERLQGILEAVPGLRTLEAETSLVGATPLGVPRCARFLVSLLAREFVPEAS